MKPDRALQDRAAAGREAIKFGSDPLLVLAAVVWPSADVLAAARSGRGGEPEHHP